MNKKSTVGLVLKICTVHAVASFDVDKHKFNFKASFDSVGEPQALFVDIESFDSKDSHGNPPPNQMPFPPNNSSVFSL